MSPRVQLELPMHWPDKPAPYVPAHGVILAVGGYAKAVRCNVGHAGRGFLYLAPSASEALWECANCGRRFGTSAVRERQQGALLALAGTVRR